MGEDMVADEEADTAVEEEGTAEAGGGGDAVSTLSGSRCPQQKYGQSARVFHLGAVPFLPHSFTYSRCSRNV